MSDLLLTTQEAAEVLGIPARTLDQWRYLGKGPAYVRVGRHVRYLQNDIDAFLTENRVEPEEVA